MQTFIRQIADEFKTELQKIYGSDFAELILFGSYSKGTYNEESDIDFAVVLNNSAVTSTSEIFKLSDITNEIGLKYGQMISHFEIPVGKFKNSKLGIYEEIRNYGIRI
jgi:predicted nucleotidyltransferase